MGATKPRDKSQTKQDYRTPQDLRRAVEKRFGTISIDLAASDGHELVPHVKHFTPEQDSLKQDWLKAIRTGVAWLNPPFRMAPDFAAKARDWAIAAKLEGRSGPVLCMLVPSSVDAVWWDDSVRTFAIVYALAPRVTFVGETEPYPRGCALCVYDPRYAPTSSGVHLWRWK